jgi:hypothetical protein
LDQDCSRDSNPHHNDGPVGDGDLYFDVDSHADEHRYRNADLDAYLDSSADVYALSDLHPVPNGDAGSLQPIPARPGDD